MKPFDIETYKADPSREIVTRDGHKARITCTDKKGIFPIIALVSYEGREDVHIFRESGHHRFGFDELDLFFASEKHKGWINICKGANSNYCGSVYETKEEALAVNLVGDRVATIMIEWEE